MAALVTVAIYYDLPSAVVAKARLDQHGFAVILQDWQFSTVVWHYLHALGGLRLMVPEPEAAEAREVLSEPAAPSDPEPLDTCPACGSDNVFRRSSWVSLAVFAVVFFFASKWAPILFRTAGRSCRNCRHRWQDKR